MDRGDLLNLIRHNVELNKEIVKFPIDVMELDFQQPSLKVEIAPDVKVVIAADGNLFKKTKVLCCICFFFLLQ